MFIRKRAGKIARLNAENKAYASANASARARYDAIEQRELTHAWGRVIQTDPLMRRDADHNSFIEIQGAIPLPDLTKD